ncbi:MAG: glycoside hydrolase [Thermoguttaceae bacterium]
MHTANLLLLAALCGTAAAEDNLLDNGDFEAGLAGWNELWTRTPGGRLALQSSQSHGGRQSVRIVHAGSEDWSFERTERIEVEEGQIYELRGWVQVAGEGNATLCVTLRDRDDRPTDWAFGGVTARATRTPATDGWKLLRSRFIITPGAKTITPRLIGNGPSQVRFDDVSLSLRGTLAELRAKDLPATLAASSDTLDVTLDVAGGSLSVSDRRTKRTWAQRPADRMVVLDARPADDGFTLELLEPTAMLRLKAVIRLDNERPEITVELSATGPQARAVTFPPPFDSEGGQFLVIPVNEGISYPVDDQTLSPMYYHLFGGHGLCMAWYGVTDGTRAAMTIVETPDDAAVGVPRLDGRLCLAPQWLPQKGTFGPARRLRYVFFDDGGYVAMCKYYRRHARQIGLLKTLAEKRAKNPDVDRLIGAVNVWCWDHDPVAVCRRLQSLGIERILWSHRAEPEVLGRLNALGVLTSRYDIFQDTMNPEVFPKLHGVHPDWTTEAWPGDLMRGADGDWTRGWRVRGKDGEMYPCGTLCDRQAVEYARRRVSEELKTHPYGCRFIDTTTATPWRECYDEDHPMTRSQSRHWKMELLRVISEQCGLVTGSETGHEAAVPFVHYFEGMLSLGPYRVPEAGRRMIEPWDEVPDRVAKFQTGHFYRLPLWELVYHDCVVAGWYWGDYNNKLPSLWDRRDLFNALYGTPPMFMFNTSIFGQHQDRFVASYQTATPVARATGYREMLSHRWLTPDHAVQQTRFAGGVTVTVNFGPQPYKMDDAAMLGPLSHRVEGMTPAKK